MAKAKTKLTTFQEMMHYTFACAQDCTDERRKLDDKLDAVKKQEDGYLRLITRMNRIAYLNGFLPVGEWYEAKNNLLKCWNLQTSTYDFSTYIHMRNDLKVMKFEVRVEGRKNELSANPHEVHGGYSYYDYIQRRYSAPPKGQELTKGFKTLEEAEQYMSKWRTRIYEDHAEEIRGDVNMAELCRESGFKYNANTRWNTKYYK